MRTHSMAPTPMELLQVTPGIGLHVHDWDRGKPVVLIPGWPLTNASYDRQMSELARTGFLACSIPLRKFKKSDSPWVTYAYYVFAEDLVAVANLLDFSAVPLGSHGIGGAIAIHYTGYHKARLRSRLALFAAPAPGWNVRRERAGNHEVLVSNMELPALDGGWPLTPHDHTADRDQLEVPMDPGVATWFLCQGRSKSAEDCFE